MFSFRQKIFISLVCVFLLFIALMFPFATHTVRKIASKAMEDRANELIAQIETAPNNEALIRRLKEQKATLFFRVSVIDNEHKILYDSHTKRLLGPRFSQEYVVDHPEVLQAFEKGLGYNEDYSELLEQKFSYLAKAFDFHGKTYVIRSAFPHKYVSDLTHDCEMGFLGLATAILVLFSFMTWFIIHHLTSPIQQIINAITPYQQGKQPSIPEIHISPPNSHDDFGKLAMTLNSLSKKVQDHINTLNKLLEMRKDFIANASHELKTPITIIRGFAEMLHDHPELPKETMIQVTEKIVRNCQRMTGLIKDLLTLSDIENIPASRLVNCDVVAITARCCTHLQDVFPSAKIQIHKKENESYFLVADPSLIELAITNLIENAIKYSPSPAHVDITFENTAQALKFSVTDQGIGIPESDLEHIFERFYTVNKAHSQKLGGSGLGLSIVQTIIYKHFGQISVVSESNKGTTFTVILPHRTKQDLDIQDLHDI